MAWCATHNKAFPDIAPSCPWCNGELDETDEDFEEEEEEEEAACTCDFDEVENCPVHYPIDDGSEDDDCMDCGMCDDCIARTKAYFEEQENDLEHKP